MSYDEILIRVLALATGVLLFVGLAQALEGRPRPRRSRRSSRLPTGWRSFRAEERVLEHRARGVRTGVSPFSTPPRPPVTETPRPTWPPDERSRVPPPAPIVIEELPAPEQISLLDAAPSPEPPSPESAAPQPVSMAAPVEEDTVVTAPGAPIPEEIVAPASTLARLTPALVADCARLLKAGRPDEVRALAEPLLKRRSRGRGRTAPSYDRALLWCLVGLTHREEGEEAGLRAAFEQGVRALPKDDTSSPDPGVVALADSLGSQLLASGESAADASGATLAGLRLSVGLLRGVAVAQPGRSTDGASAEDAAGADGPEASGGDELPPWGKALRAHLAVERARDALANACERKVTALLEGGDRAAAHRWLREVAGWDELTDRMEALEEPYWEAVTGEVTRLTSQALESADDLDGAMRTLQSAEAVVRDLPESALPRPESTLPRPESTLPRMDELRRRLWWSYTKLGVQRLESGDEGAALEPLYHALRLADADADRAMETRHSLAQGLDAMATRASDLIAERLRAADHVAAEAVGQALCRAIDRGLAEGVSQEELAGALDKRQHVMGLIAQADAR